MIKTRQIGPLSNLVLKCARKENCSTTPGRWLLNVPMSIQPKADKAALEALRATDGKVSNPLSDYWLLRGGPCCRDPPGPAETRPACPRPARDPPGPADRRTTTTTRRLVPSQLGNSLGLHKRIETMASTGQSKICIFWQEYFHWTFYI